MPLFKNCSIGNVEDINIASWLTSREVERFEQFKVESRKQDWLIGRWTAKSLVQEFLTSIEDSVINKQQIEISKGDHDEPLISVGDKPRSDLCLSLSHSNGNAYVGITQIESEGRIGVDIEKIRIVHYKLAERILSPFEKRQLNTQFPSNQDEGLILYWSLKEAAYKCIRPVAPLMKTDFEVTLSDESGTANLAFVYAGSSYTLDALYNRNGDYFLTCVLGRLDIIESLTHHKNLAN